MNQLDDTFTYNRGNLIDKGNSSYAIISDDFQSPIGEFGNIKCSYRLLKLLNLFENSYGEDFVQKHTMFQKTSPSAEDTGLLRYAMRVKDNAGYIFVNNHARLLKMNDFNDVRFKLPNAKIIPENPLCVKSDVSFFFPFNMNYGGATAEYISAQPILNYDNAYIFKEIEGIEPVYKFEHQKPIKAKAGKNNGFTFSGKLFITLTVEEAKYLYQFDDGIYIGDGCDLISDCGNIKGCAFGTVKYYHLENNTFVAYSNNIECELATVNYTVVKSPNGIDGKYFYELHGNMNKNTVRKLAYYKIEVTGDVGYLYINYSGDSAQLYIDGELFNDHFYNGVDWIIPAKSLYHKSAIMVIAEFTPDIYIEKEPEGTKQINQIRVFNS